MCAAYKLWHNNVTEIPCPNPPAFVYTGQGGGDCPLAKEDKEAEPERTAELRTTWEGSPGQVTGVQALKPGCDFGPRDRAAGRQEENQWGWVPSRRPMGKLQMEVCTAPQGSWTPCFGTRFSLEDFHLPSCLQAGFSASFLPQTALFTNIPNHLRNKLKLQKDKIQGSHLCTWVGVSTLCLVCRTGVTPSVHTPVQAFSL